MVFHSTTEHIVEPYAHLALFAIGYGALAGLFSLGTNQSELLGIPAVAVTQAAVVLAATWSVFGPGAYWKRFLMAHAMCLIVLAGGYFGNLAALFTSSQFEAELSDGISNLPLLLIASLMAQIPLWFLRGLLGWQFVYRDRQSQSAFGIFDIFVFTFLVAVCFGSLPIYQQHLQSQIVFEDESVRFLDDKDFSRYQFWADIWMASGFAALGLVVSLPALLFVFRSSDGAVGCGLTAAYVFGIYVLVLLVLVISMGQSSDLGEAVFVSGFLLGCYGAAYAIPLAVSRTVGFALVGRFYLTGWKPDP